MALSFILVSGLEFRVCVSDRFKIFSEAKRLILQPLSEISPIACWEYLVDHGIKLALKGPLMHGTSLY
jgi:hypothetical protein